MSALGQKQTFAAHKSMSALPPIAGMCSALGDVCFVPKADIQPKRKGRHSGGQLNVFQLSQCIPNWPIAIIR